MKKTILLIAILSGITLYFSSCTTAHHCAAYSQLEIDNGTNTSEIQTNMVEKEI